MNGPRTLSSTSRARWARFNLRAPRHSFLSLYRTPHVAPDRLENPARRRAPFELVAIVEEDGLAEIDLTFEPPEHLEVAPQPFRTLDHA